MIEIVFGGGAGEIGGPNFCVLRHKGSNLAVDCGIGKVNGFEEKTILPNFKAVKGRLSGLLITHGHLDHVGAVPCISEKVNVAYDFSVYMSAPTSEFAKMQWTDTLRLAERNGRAPAFYRKSVEAAESFISFAKADYTYSVGAFKVRPIAMGHILGSQGYYIEIDGKRIFITGDLSLKGYPLVKGISEESVKFLRKMRLHALIIDSTYAGKELPESGSESARFQKDVENFLKQGKRILIPCFAIDRAQKMFLHVRSVPGVANLFIDGNAQRASKIYQKYTLGLNGAEAHFVGNGNSSGNRGSNRRRNFSFPLSIEEIRTAILRKKPSVIIASSGMMFDGSASNWYASELAEDKNAAILLVGYQAEGSPGAELLKAKKGGEILLNGEERTLNAKVESYCFTAHAREHETARLIELIDPKVVIFSHGEPEDINTFIEKHSDLPGNKIVPKNGEVIPI